MEFLQNCILKIQNWGIDYDIFFSGSVLHFKPNALKLYIVDTPSITVIRKNNDWFVIENAGSAVVGQVLKIVKSLNIDKELAKQKQYQ